VTPPPPLRLAWLEPTGEDARPWSPFRETGSLSRLLFGSCTLGDRLAWAAGLEGGGTSGGNAEGPLLLLNPRFVPDARLPVAELLRILEETGGPVPLYASPSEGEGEKSPGQPTTPGAFLVGWLLPEWSPPAAPTDASPEPVASPVPRLSGILLASPWDLMVRNPARITRDLAGALPAQGRPLTLPPPGVDVLGSWPVTVGEGVTLDPQVILDAREGPIHMGDGVEVRGQTRIEGPAWIGEGSRLLGGVLSAVSAGPVCRLRGEVASSVLGGWCNKAHDGYLGHAVLGSWVNLGAFTTNSDLKNTYGTVRVPLDAGTEVDSGQIKVGVLLGDHVKTGIGTLLNTGTVVGAGSTLFAGGERPPRWVPPFSWGSGRSLVPTRLEAFLEVAGRAMARRDRSLAAAEEEALRALWSATHAEGGEGGGP
jgi:acetyltransferase-like isoleucine patch superfamily enzyme